MEKIVLEVNYIGNGKVFVPQTYGVPEHYAEIDLEDNDEPKLNDKLKVEFTGVGGKVKLAEPMKKEKKSK